MMTNNLVFIVLKKKACKFLFVEVQENMFIVKIFGEKHFIFFGME